VSNKKRLAERNEKAARAAQMRRERDREQQRSARTIVTLIVAVVVVIVVVAAVAIIPRLGDPGPSPEGITADNGFRYTAADVPASEGSSDAGSAGSSLEPVDVVVYEDFQCPTCKAFEAAAGSYLEQQVAIGAATLEYRPIAILDRASSTDYSTRSANAAACVFEDANIATYVEFHNALYANQPPEGGAGLSNDDLTQIAQESGASESVGSCISRGTYEDWAARATDAASQAGVVGTPTVRVAGEDVTGQGGAAPGMQDVMAAISDARGAQE
jgi:protein-disulfide isomerase